MNKRMLILLAVGTIACTKKNDGGNTQPPKDQTVDTIGYISTQVHNFAQGWDTTGNYITTFSFFRSMVRNGTVAYRGDTNVAGYTSLGGDYRYRIRYVGGQDLIDPNQVLARYGAIDVFRVRKELLGKPLFEVYDLKTGNLVKRFICSADSAGVDMGYSVWDNLTVTPTQTGDALNYCLTVKQTDQLGYY